MIFLKIFSRISSLKEAILQKLPTKAKYLSAFWLGFLVLILVSCSSTKHAVTVVDRVKQDTIYLSNIQYDSIYVSQDHSIEYHPQSLSPSPSQTDTIFIKDKSVEYKYRLLRDTIHVHQVDSIPVIKEVEITKEVKFVPWYAKTLAWIGALAIITLVLLTLKKIYLK